VIDGRHVREVLSRTQRRAVDVARLTVRSAAVTPVGGLAGDEGFDFFFFLFGSGEREEITLDFALILRGRFWTVFSTNRTLDVTGKSTSLSG
jgi:hypothetical protein